MPLDLGCSRDGKEKEIREKIMKECIFVDGDLVCEGCVNHEHNASNCLFAHERNKLLIYSQFAKCNLRDHQPCSSSFLQSEEILISKWDNEETLAKGDSGLNDSDIDIIITERSADMLNIMKESHRNKFIDELPIENLV